MLLYPHFEYREHDNLDFRNCKSRIYIKLYNIEYIQIELMLKYKILTELDLFSIAELVLYFWN